MNTPSSPCISSCCLTEENICSGCFRSLSEIKEWSQASDSHKQIIIINALKRANDLKETH